MNSIIVRQYHPEDEKTIENITFRTGFKGDDLTKKKHFKDRRLFYLIFIYYYPKYEPEHCFVAEESQSNKVVGFICGTPDTDRQERLFQKHIPWRIGLRAIAITLWRYPRTFATILKMSKMLPILDLIQDKELIVEYPAHLHINLQPEYQGLGIGTKLIRIFEDHLKNLGIKGVHLQTSNYNKKAIPFYRKNGYTLIREDEMDHFLFENLKLITYAKILEFESAIIQ